MGAAIVGNALFQWINAIATPLAGIVQQAVGLILNNQHKICQDLDLLRQTVSFLHTLTTTIKVKK
jgi:hypothetical protein